MRVAPKYIRRLARKAARRLAMIRVHLNTRHISGSRTAIGRGPIVLSLVRDGASHVQPFLEYYLSHGVDHIILLDNGSTDDTIDIAWRYPHVTIVQNRLPYKYFKNTFREYLLDRFGPHRWCLCVDIDEFFDYPESDLISLRSFTDYLAKYKFTALVACVLDMFPDCPMSAVEPSNMRSACRFYDVTNIKTRPYLPDCNTTSAATLVRFSGGIRRTVFGLDDVELTSHPLLYGDGLVRPVSSRHAVENARIADVTGVLYHYKFVRTFPGKVAGAVRERQYYRESCEYLAYAEVLDHVPDVVLAGDSSRELTSVDALVKCGLLHVSQAYRHWIHARCDTPERDASSP